MKTSLTSSPGTFARSRAPWIATLPSSGAVTACRDPWKLPMGGARHPGDNNRVFNHDGNLRFGFGAGNRPARRLVVGRLEVGRTWREHAVPGTKDKFALAFPSGFAGPRTI